MTTTLLYDGSLNGLLTTIFIIYDHKIKSPIISKASKTQKNLFDGMEVITTDIDKAKRVWNRFESLCNYRDSHQVYCAFLSEINGIENTIYEYIKSTFQKQKTPSGDFTNPSVLKIAQAAKMVGREKHRMEAFVRFHLIDEKTYYANIEPDFNVLPLITKHFKNRYADQNWVIYDLSRNYGISYDQNIVQEVYIDFKTPKGQRGILNTTATSNKNNIELTTGFQEKENNYRDLWNQYFQSTNIKSRKNLKLHVQHVPKRYWKYLSEKL
ncbi:TIGR03915 family putative DNA repair protein [Nonlabens ulvanivorans]|uniref:DNA metabolism protein n=1 Tax=Nonlabens ulvanivorans TaxID=906888 RepID=A0A084JUP0_NONUL|nr:TIGR03915 family putative DNA repair protein [Nonlabens ulvanivorans]KEZ92674.1 DNA metabolism protein [Nonlabens ulvanivorans]PRX15516.1 putative DNA metabolism protein [Nonlabens ulvanivorans]